MTVQITPPGGTIQDQARIAVDAALAARTGFRGYDSGLRQLAIDAIVDYRPAYVRLSDYGHNTGTLAAYWAMGGLQGLPGLDPAQPIYGLRAVAAHMQTIWPADWYDKLLGVLRNLQPINAMALLDRQILLEERGISERDVDWSDEANRARNAAAAKEHAAKTMISGKGA